jgi:hypothetical protein
MREIRKKQAIGIVLSLVAGLFAASALQLPGLALPLAQAYKLPDTGQSKCYDNDQEMPCPQKGQPFYGQDANYQRAQMAYRDNGDGTVTDLNTGLMWQQGDSQNSVKRSKDQAVKYCASLDLANHSDWRLPTIDELTSLVDVGIPYPGPTINTSYFPECRSRYYWSSSRYMQNLNLAWHVYFTDGIVSAGDSDRGWYVRCVRGGP